MPVLDPFSGKTASKMWNDWRNVLGTLTLPVGLKPLHLLQLLIILSTTQHGSGYENFCWFLSVVWTLLKSVLWEYWSRIQISSYTSFILGERRQNQEDEWSLLCSALENPTFTLMLSHVLHMSHVLHRWNETHFQPWKSNMVAYARLKKMLLCMVWENINWMYKLEPLCCVFVGGEQTWSGGSDKKQDWEELTREAR